MHAVTVRSLCPRLYIAVVVKIRHMLPLDHRCQTAKDSFRNTRCHRWSHFSLHWVMRSRCFSRK